MTIQGYRFKLEEEDDLLKLCRKIMVNKNVVVPPHSRKTVTGLILISSARIVKIPDWLTRHRMIRPWVQILNSLVDIRASNMSLILMNDSEEVHECRMGEQVTTMIPDPIGLSEWYGEEQASQVHRKASLDSIGFMPIPKMKVVTPESTSPVAERDSADPADSGARKSPSILPPPDQIAPTVHDDTLKEVTFHDMDEINSVILETVVSEHIITDRPTRLYHSLVTFPLVVNV